MGQTIAFPAALRRDEGAGACLQRRPALPPLALALGHAHGAEFALEPLLALGALLAAAGRMRRLFPGQRSRVADAAAHRWPPGSVAQ